MHFTSHVQIGGLVEQGNLRSLLQVFKVVLFELVTVCIAIQTLFDNQFISKIPDPNTQHERME